MIIIWRMTDGSLIASGRRGHSLSDQGGSDHLLMGNGAREGRGDKARSRVRTTRALLVIGAPLLAARIPIFAHIRSLHMMIDPGNGM